MKTNRTEANKHMKKNNRTGERNKGILRQGKGKKK